MDKNCRVPMTTTKPCKGWRCRRDATGADGFCGPHRGAAARVVQQRAKKDEYYVHQAIQARGGVARVAYAEAWRRSHPDAAYTRAWECPLCGLHVQSTLVDAGIEQAYFPARGALEAHQETHGGDWTAYWATGTEA